MRKANREANYIYTISIQKDSEVDVYLARIHSVPIRFIDNIKLLGYFYIGNSLFIVKNGCNPDNLFVNSNNKKLFSYTIYENYKIITEGFSSWFFLYIYKRDMRFVDLPEILIDRLGFSTCVNDESPSASG
ncbi:hypothetical protein [Dysgonomonas sp. 521]|uniref:hypothetical protein n=1 Tax=Dysgonomonas sp. 521 TaxID=2302932 RepID=UPI001C88003B|nr:hypothetical protein [Dysgonomonas sp. 521]